MKQLEDMDYMKFVGDLESQYLIHLSEITDAIFERTKDGVELFGDELPWMKTHDKFRMRPGEVTVWAGINGHGKSMVLSHVVAHLIKFTPCLIASLEMPLDALGQRLVRQMIGTDKPTREYIEKALNWTDDRLWVYDQLDTVESERIYGMIIYAMRELGIKHIVIDSLMKCGIDDDDYNGQKKFIDRLCWAAKTFNGHIHLVHHIRKTRSEEDLPDKNDVMGSSAITNLIDNLIIVHRNKAKENSNEPDEEMPDARLYVAKQRHGEWEGKIALWFDKTSQQYLPSKGGRKEWFSFGEQKDNVEQLR
jgi:twinkle protein